MPSYAFRCVEGCEFDALHTIAEVPPERECVVCGAQAVRRITAPHLSRTGSSAFRAIDDAARSSYEPRVTTSLPRSASNGTPVTRNPQHAKLPRA